MKLYKKLFCIGALASLIGCGGDNKFKNDFYEMEYEKHYGEFLVNGSTKYMKFRYSYNELDNYICLELYKSNESMWIADGNDNEEEGTKNLLDGNVNSIYLISYDEYGNLEKCVMAHFDDEGNVKSLYKGTEGEALELLPWANNELGIYQSVIENGFGDKVKVRKE